MLLGVEQMVVRPGEAGEGNQRYTCGSENERVLFHFRSPLRARSSRAFGLAVSTKGRFRKRPFCLPAISEVNASCAWIIPDNRGRGKFRYSAPFALRSVRPPPSSARRSAACRPADRSGGGYR